MKALTFCFRSLVHHRRTNLAVLLGVMAGTSVLTGALLVGDSMRGSLRELSLGRLSKVDHVLVSGTFFHQDRVTSVTTRDGFDGSFDALRPMILVSGSVGHAESDRRSNRVQIYGVKNSFFDLDDVLDDEQRGELAFLDSEDRSAILSEPLAQDLGVKVGERIIVRLEKATAVHKEMVLGREDDSALALRLTVKAIFPSKGLSGFSQNPAQVAPRNLFLPLARLQRSLEKKDRINGFLASGKDVSETRGAEGAARLGDWLAESLVLQDVDLKLNVDEERKTVSLSSERLLLDSKMEELGLSAVKKAGPQPFPVYTYLANQIKKVQEEGKDETRSIPYSTVCGIDLDIAPPEPLTLLDGTSAGPIRPDGILLSEWAADDLEAKVGDRLEVTYFVDGVSGELETRSAEFLVQGVVRMEGLADDPGLAPEVGGMTDVGDISDWDPPFPVDFSLIRSNDEVYWDDYRATPKAFLNLGRSQSLFAGDQNRFGHLTSIQTGQVRGKTIQETAELVRAEVRRALTPDRTGLAPDPVRERSLQASQGAMDFGGLFIGFSFFIIFAAGLLVSLLFRLNVERRAREVGALRALGFAQSKIARILLAEGALVAGLGGVVGLFLAIGYANFILSYLKSNWSERLSVGFLELHITPMSMALGYLAGFVVALVSIALALRGLGKASPRGLLAGVVSSGGLDDRRKRGRLAPALAGVSLVSALLLFVAGVVEAIPAQGAFFGVGMLLLVGGLAGLLVWVRRDGRGRFGGVGFRAMCRLGVRNATLRPRRTLSTAGLVASATFLLIGVGAFRQEGGGDPTDRNSGTGGFSLLAESSLPIFYDLDTEVGREELALSDELNGALSGGSVIPFRLSEGDESSCLNLYQPTRPRILGAPRALVDRGGFGFAKSTADTKEDQGNPWRLLSSRLPDGAIPVIGDMNAVQYQLKSGLGKDLLITDEKGNPVTLRFVALMSRSVLQNEVVIGEDHFIELFPSTSGYRFFLFESAQEKLEQLGGMLEKELATSGLDVASTRERLAEYHAIENTYLSTFQLLGGLGLLLGTLGLATVVLRGVLERTGELALLRAVGYKRSDLATMVLAENGSLLLFGLLIGGISALFAIAPQAFAGTGGVSFGTIAFSIALIFITGMAAGSIAVVASIRAPLIQSLRSE